MLCVKTIHLPTPPQAYSPIEGTKETYPPPPSLPNLDISSRHTLEYHDALLAMSKKRLSAPVPSPRLHFQSYSNEDAETMKIRIIYCDFGVSRIVVDTNYSTLLKGSTMQAYHATYLPQALTSWSLEIHFGTIDGPISTLITRNIGPPVTYSITSPINPSINASMTMEPQIMKGKVFSLDYVGKLFLWKGLGKRPAGAYGSSMLSMGENGIASDKSGQKKRSSLGLEIRGVLGKALTNKWYGLFPATEVIRIGGNDMQRERHPLAVLQVLHSESKLELSSSLAGLVDIIVASALAIDQTEREEQKKDERHPSSHH